MLSRVRGSRTAFSRPACRLCRSVSSVVRNRLEAVRYFPLRQVLPKAFAKGRRIELKSLLEHHERHEPVFIALISRDGGRFLYFVQLQKAQNLLRVCPRGSLESSPDGPVSPKTRNCHRPESPEVARPVDALSWNLWILLEDCRRFFRLAPVPFGNIRALHDQFARLTFGDSPARLVDQHEAFVCHGMASPESARLPVPGSTRATVKRAVSVVEKR